MDAFRYRRRTPDLAKNAIVDPLVVFIPKVRFGHQKTSLNGFVQFTGKPETGISIFFKYFRPFPSFQGDTIRPAETGRYESYTIAHLPTSILFPLRVNSKSAATTHQMSLNTHLICKMHAQNSIFMEYRFIS
jgi:hypothetical protein